MTDRQPIGSLLDALGVTVSLEPEQQITEAVIITKISNFGSGATLLGFHHSDGLDWISQLGLLTAAQQALSTGVDEADE